MNLYLLKNPVYLIIKKENLRSNHTALIVVLFFHPALTCKSYVD